MKQKRTKTAADIIDEKIRKINKLISGGNDGDMNWITQDEKIIGNGKEGKNFDYIESDYKILLFNFLSHLEQETCTFQEWIQDIRRKDARLIREATEFANIVVMPQKKMEKFLEKCTKNIQDSALYDVVLPEAMYSGDINERNKTR
jgi:hypothetical protein